MNAQALFEQIKARRSYLCVGLDTDLDRIPKHLLDTEDPIFEFNKAIIDATKEYCVAYKPNTAFFEAYGAKGWTSLKKTCDYIPSSHFVIADAKRGDIGNTCKMYAKAFFDDMHVDAITVSPYMGSDSVTPFLAYEDKWVIILGATSNASSADFQFEEGNNLYEKVLSTSSQWGNTDNTMYVIGATHPELFENVRRIVPNHFLLVPGVGAQGGDLEALSRAGLNEQCGLLVNSSRGIIYASDGLDFAEAAGQKAQAIQQDMFRLLQAHCNL